MNKQPIEKLSTDAELQVNSIFWTIQGEGPFSGRRAVFLRLAGCNLQCPGCDTEYIKRERYDIQQVIRKVMLAIPQGCEFEERERPLLVITGGEPFRQPNALEQLLKEMIHSFDIQIETNGTLRPCKIPLGTMIVCSPKTGSVNSLLIPFISAYKYVLSADSVSDEDGLPVKVLGHSASKQGVARPFEGYKGPIYVQPMDTTDQKRDKLNRLACVRACQKYGYTLQLQIHKIVGVE